MRNRPRLRYNAIALAIVLWAFGLSTTVTLISVWGRAVASDTVTIDTAARELASADVVVRRLVGEIEEIALAGGDTSALFVDVAEQPEVEATMEALMSDVVIAATATDGLPHEIDVAERLAPVAPIVVASAAARGIPLDRGLVEQAISSIEPIVVRPPNSPPIAGPQSPTANAFSIATLIGLILMLITGWSAVALVEDRRTMLRSLSNRIAVSALSFSIMLQLGSWVADPTGGSTPIRSAASVLIGSKIWIPMTAALVATAVGLILFRFRLRNGSSDAATSGGHSLFGQDTSEEMSALSPSRGA